MSWWQTSLRRITGAATAEEPEESLLDRAPEANDSSPPPQHKAKKPTDQDAYKRFRPNIHYTDRAFTKKEAEFQAMIEEPGRTLHDVLDMAGFTEFEKDLLYVVKEQDNPGLYKLHMHNRDQFRKLRLPGGRYYGLVLRRKRQPTDATWLTMFWFGLPVPPILNRPRPLIDLTKRPEEEPERDYYLSREETKPLSFLSDIDGEILYDLGERAEEHGDQDSTQARHLGKGEGILPLRGGARALASSAATANGDATDPAVGTQQQQQQQETVSKQKWIRMYGYQGSVLFDLWSDQSIKDALTRLVGPEASLTMVFWPRRGGSGRPDASRDVRALDAVRTHHAFPRIRFRFAPDGAEDEWALFVSAAHVHEQWFAHHWEPTDADLAAGGGGGGGDASAVVRCTRHGAPSDGNVAYLRIPANAVQLSSNQYSAWLVVAARILAPDAALAALRHAPGGAAPHCQFGLHPEDGSEIEDGRPAFQSYGGFSFSPRSWAKIVRAVQEAGARELQFDVVPLDSSATAVHLPGLNAASTVVDEGRLTGIAVPHHATAPRSGASSISFKQRLAARINAAIDAAAAGPDEAAALACVDIWPDGRFWDQEALPPVRASWPCTAVALAFGHEHGGLLPVAEGTAQALEVPTVVAFRPAYREYIAHFPGQDGPGRFAGPSAPFDVDEPLAAVRDRLRNAARLAELDVDRDCIRIEQAAPPQLRAEATMVVPWFHLDRPDFLVTPYTTEAEWLQINSQIVGSELWCTKAAESYVLKPVDYTKEPWGFRSSYPNLAPMRFQVQQDSRPTLAPAVAPQASPVGEAFSPLALPEAAFSSNNRSGAGAGAGVGLGVVHTPSEAARLERALDGMYQLTLRRAFACPYPDCDAWFHKDSATSNENPASDLQRHLHDAHPAPQRCCFCTHVFAAQAAADDKIAHMMAAHAQLFAADGGWEQAQGEACSNNVTVVTSEAPAFGVCLGPAARAILATTAGPAPQPRLPRQGTAQALAGAKATAMSVAAAALTKKVVPKKRRPGPTAAQRADPSYRPSQDGTDSESFEFSVDDEEDSSSDGDNAVRRAPKKRKTAAAKDPAYRPNQDDAPESNSESEHSLVYNTNKRAQARRKPSSSSAAKDPTYRPSRDEQDEDDESSLSDLSGPLTPPPPTKNNKGRGPGKGARLDPSYRPSQDAADSSDDEDDELRRSAMPERHPDPTDPAGKRTRVLREGPLTMSGALPTPPKETPKKNAKGKGPATTSNAVRKVAIRTPPAPASP